MAELITALAQRVAALERGQCSHGQSIDALAEAVTVLQDQLSRKTPVKSKAAK